MTYEEAISAGGQPHQTPYEAALAAGGQDVTAPAAPAVPPPPPSFLDEVGARIHGHLKTLAEPFENATMPTSLADVGARLRQNIPIVAHDTAEGFKGIGSSLLAANQAAGQAIAHPVETVTNPAAGRETLRGVYGNIPFLNLGIQHMGGPAETSPEDTARAPGFQALGGLAGIPLASELGAAALKAPGVLAEGGAAVASKLSRAAEGIGTAAEERGVTRALDKMGERVNKKARAGLEDDRVDALVRENPEVRKAAGNDTKLAETVKRARTEAGGKLDEIYSAAAPEVDLAVPVAKMDARIAELAAGDVEARAAAKALQKVRDEFNDAMGGRAAVSPKELRAEQSAYQKQGYAKNLLGDPDVSAKILASREASKAVGDAVFEHVTGMDYEAAKAAAAKDAKSLAAQLVKVNDTVTAVNKIEAGIADRAGKVTPPAGVLGLAKRVASHTLLPAVGGMSHGVGGALAGVVTQEALHALPGAARATAAAADRALARTAPVASRVSAASAEQLAKFVQAAQAGNPFAQRVIATVAAAPGGAARLAAAGAEQ